MAPWKRPIGDAAQRVDQGLGDVADDGQAAAHIAVQSAVADGELAFIAGGQDQRAELIGERHQGDAAQAGLQVLFGDVRGKALEHGASELWNCSIGGA